MKTQYLISFVIMCLSFTEIAQAQHNPIEEIMKKYPSREGVTYVTLSQAMLNSLFPQSRTSGLKAPEVYQGISFSDKVKDLSNISTDLSKMLIDYKYETFMEVNDSESDILRYYLKQKNAAEKEVVILRQHKNQVASVIYMKGDINISKIKVYLTHIRMMTR